MIAEHLDHPDLWELTFLYIPAIRFDDVWSTLLMLGFRTDDDGHDTEFLFNFNLFADIGPGLTVGVESDYASGLDDESELLVMPQVHWEITDRFMIQAGASAEFDSVEADGVAALRVIYSF